MFKIEYLQKKLNDIFRKENFLSEPMNLYEPIGYTLSLGGKRIRPLLVLMGCDMFGGNLNDAIQPAIGIELFHNFTLLHDDIMDQASLRRGNETVHKKWNPNIAILCGDTMFAMAFRYISHVNEKVLPEVIKTFTDTAIEVCEGQLFDLNYEIKEKVSLDDYLMMIRLKTATLLAASLKIGSLLANADQSDLEMIHSFGENLGMAFQLQDDLLDVFGEEQRFGKKTGGDILENKKTFLYLKAFESATKKELEILHHAFFTPRIEPQQKISLVKKVYETLKIKEITMNEIGSYHEKALTFLDNIQVSESRKVELRSLTKQLLTRDF